MDMAIKNSGTTIDMRLYVDQLLEGEDVEVFASPGTKNMFIVKSNLKALQEEVRKSFHSKSKKFESPKSLLGFCNHFLSKWVTPSRQILEG
jgi:hypothetical protein